MIMSVYHNSFTYLSINSLKDKKWIVSSFNPDNGETDSFLTQEQVYSDSYKGTKRILYGTKYSSVASPVITVIKQDGSDFSVDELRSAYKWLVGNTSASWLDLYIGEEVKYRLLVTIKDVKPQKQDARTIGLNIYCESLSPWGYSPLQTVSQLITGEEEIIINNLSDDAYNHTGVNVKFENGQGETLKIENSTTGETTEINNLKTNEIITLNDNMTITSDDTTRIFGSDFNFVFPRLKSGENKLKVTGAGTITFEYVYCIKMGDMAIDINSLSNQICDSDGNITVQELDWSRIVNTPQTLSGYGIDDAYTKEDIDNKLSNIQVSSISWENVTHKPEMYSKDEVDALLRSTSVEVDVEELENMLAEVLV